MDTVACKVCENKLNNEIFEVREMFLGLREKFFYQKCGSCGLLQLMNIPEDLSKYYPTDKYYSLTNGTDEKIKVESLRKIKAEYLLYDRNRVLGKLLSIGYKVPEYYQWLKKVNVQFQDAILDVGCGSGGLLKSLNKMGFTNLTGIDPFNDKDLDYGDLKIYRKDVFGIDGSYDFIMLNHVFEHVDEPLKVLQQLNHLLKNGKYLLIRTPVMNSYAWHTYTTNWMSLDAPRHLIIHTEKSIRILCERSGFILKDIVYDSTGGSLIGSEQYKTDIPLIDPTSYFTDRKNNKLFSEEQVAEFNQIASQKNNEGAGDQAAFYLFKP